MDLEQVPGALGAPPVMPETPPTPPMSGGDSRLGALIDKFGTKFAGDTGIANLILAEMDRRGVKEASEAASEAVQNVLDQLRKEATAVLEMTKSSEKSVSDLMDKLTDVEESVHAATDADASAASPSKEAAMNDAQGADTAPVPPPAGEGAPPPDAGGGMPPPDATGGAGTPPPGDMGAAPPPDATGGGAPPAAGGIDEGAAAEGAAPMPDMSQLPPVDESALGDPGGDMGAPPPPPDPNMVPSDVRLKNMRSKFAAFRQQRAGTVPSDATLKKPAWKPRPETLSVIQGL